MLIVIAHAIISGCYITSFQHVYSLAQPTALILGQSSPSIQDLLEGEEYAVFPEPSVPSNLGSYGLVVVEGTADLSGSFDLLRTYVENGGGLVYLGAAAESLDLATNSDWLGAQTFGPSGFGENVTVTSSGPFGTNLLAGDFLRLQAADQAGAVAVNDLEAGADVLAQYANGGIFSYSFETGGKVFFQAYSDAGVGDSAMSDDVEELLISGMLWATTEPEPITDHWPTGTRVSTGHDKPLGAEAVVFSQSGFQSRDLPVPADAVKSIFVTADSGLINPVLYFTIDGEEYRHRVETDKGILLNFSSPLDLESARLSVDDWGSGVGRVGYVTWKNPPACNLPTGAVMNPLGGLPSDAVALGSTGPLGTLRMEMPPIPVSSLLTGFDHDVDGYVINFGQLSCPIEPEVIEIVFDEPTAFTDVSVTNGDLWGLIGYVENLGDATVYAKISVPKGTALPDGFTIIPNSEAPAQTFGAGFSLGEFEVQGLTGPTKKASALWVSADASLADPHLYLRSGNEWYSIEIDQTSGALVDFTPSISIDEVYATSDGGGTGSVSVGYVYPIAINARAGPDQSVVEEQIVYLDGRSSAGPAGALSFKWTQIEGPTVTLRDANTDSASFSAPEVGEQGARIAFRLLVSDTDGSQSSDVVVINVKNEATPNNLAPVIGAIPGATVDEGTQVVLAASAFDSDGDTLKYSWTQKNGPAAKLSGAGTPTLSITAPEVDEDSVVTFEIKVADGRGHAVTKDVVVTVVNVRGDSVTVEPIVSAGVDQVVSEGSVVHLAGEFGGDAGSQRFKWEQTSGTPVTLNTLSSLNATFVAPHLDVDTATLVFRLGVVDAQGAFLRGDEISVTVNNVPPVPAEDSVEIEEEGAQGASPLEINEPTFAAVKRLDAEEPSEIHLLSVLGAEGAFSPTPTAPVVGIWVNATSEMSALELHFTTAGRKYSMNAISDQATAYVFDRPVEISELRLTSNLNIQTIGIGYYYDQVPLASISTSTQAAPSLEPDVIQARPPEEGAIIKFARENQLIAGVMAIAVPVGIGVGLKLVSSHRRRPANPAKALFPSSDPVAGEAEKVKPVIEELERMLGRDLDTAVSASELLDKFGSGRGEGSER